MQCSCCNPSLRYAGAVGFGPSPRCNNEQQATIKQTRLSARSPAMTRPMISCIFLLLLTLQCLYQVQAWRSVRLNRYVQRCCTSHFAKVPDDSEDEVVPIKVNQLWAMRFKLIAGSDWFHWPLESSGWNAKATATT